MSKESIYKCTTQKEKLTCSAKITIFGRDKDANDLGSTASLRPARKEIKMCNWFLKVILVSQTVYM